MWDEIIGHDSVKRVLSLQLERRSFPHAYLFVGPSGIGKRMVANEFAAQLLGASALESHPDFIMFDAATESGVEEMRKLLSRLSVKPFSGQYKVAIIDNFESANPQTANALLKTLEEPSPSTIIIAVSGSRALLPTIVSRCQEFVFNPLDPTAMSKCAELWNLPATPEMVNLSFGIPARLRYLIEQPEAAAEMVELVDKLDSGMADTIAARLLLVNELAELESDKLIELMTSWIYRLKAVLALAPTETSTISRACETIDSLRRSFNKKMVLQHLLITQ